MRTINVAQHDVCPEALGVPGSQMVVDAFRLVIELSLGTEDVSVVL
jgi:hypothetical protein